MCYIFLFDIVTRVNYLLEFVSCLICEVIYCYWALYVSMENIYITNVIYSCTIYVQQSILR